MLKFSCTAEKSFYTINAIFFRSILWFSYLSSPIFTETEGQGEYCTSMVPESSYLQKTAVIVLLYESLIKESNLFNFQQMNQFFFLHICFSPDGLEQ